MDYRSQLLEGLDKKYTDMLAGSAKTPFRVKTTISSLNKYKEKKTAFTNRVKRENQQIKAAAKQMSQTAADKRAQDKLVANRIKAAKSLFRRRGIIALLVTAVYALLVWAFFSPGYYSFTQALFYDAQLDNFMPSDGEGMTAFIIAAVMVLISWIIYFTIAVKTGSLGEMIGGFFGAFFLGAAPVTLVYAVCRFLVWLMAIILALFATKVGFIVLSLAALITVFCLSRSIMLYKSQSRIICILALLILLGGLRTYQVLDEIQAEGIEYAESHDGSSMGKATIIKGEGFYGVHPTKGKGNSHYFKFEPTVSEYCTISTIGPLTGRAEIKVTTYGEGGYVQFVDSCNGVDTKELTVHFEAERTYYVTVTLYEEGYDSPRFDDIIMLFDLES